MCMRDQGNSMAINLPEGQRTCLGASHQEVENCAGAHECGLRKLRCFYCEDSVFSGKHGRWRERGRKKDQSLGIAKE